MTLNSVKMWKRGFYPPLLKAKTDQNTTNNLCMSSSHIAPFITTTPTKTRTRSVGRQKCVRGNCGSSNSSSVVLLRMSLFVLVFVLSNFPLATFGRIHPSNHDHHHNHHHHHHYHQSGGGVRTCSHRPPKPEEVRHIYRHGFIVY